METFKEESVEARKARLRADAAAETDARKKQIEASLAQTKNINAEYFRKEEELARQIAANKPVVLAPKTNEQAAKENAERYMYNTSGKAEGGVDPLLQNEPAYVQQLHGYTPVKLKASLKLTPQPDPVALAEHLAKKPQPNMNTPIVTVVDGTQIRIAPPQKTVPCPNCGEAISPAAGYHRRSDNSVCVLDESFARREGIVVPEPVKPVVKKHK
jgi:hypothetical protein